MTYDTFIFNDEVELLKLRLIELWDVVDKFVLVEARENHRGHPKKLFYTDNQSEFAPWKDKIECLVIDSYGCVGDTKESNMKREHLGREKLGEYPYESGSLIVHGDADEICKPDLIRSHKPEQGGVAVEMMFTYYFFNCMYPTNTARTIMAPVDFYRKHGFDDMRWKVGYGFICVPDGGWHHSYLGGVQALKDKIAAHVEGAPSDWVLKENPAMIQSRIDAGQLFDGSMQFKFVSVDNRFSKYVQDNLADLTEKGFIKA